MEEMTYWVFNRFAQSWSSVPFALSEYNLTGLLLNLYQS